MLIEVLKSKIHRAKVTQAELDYVGSITIDGALARAAGLVEYEKVLVADVANGHRFETYVIFGDEGSGIVCVNGAAAHCVEVGDLIIVMAFASMTPEEAAQPENAPHVVFVDEDNHVKSAARYESHGTIA